MFHIQYDILTKILVKDFDLCSITFDSCNEMQQMQ